MESAAKSYVNSTFSPDSLSFFLRVQEGHFRKEKLGRQKMKKKKSESEFIIINGLLVFSKDL